MFCSFEKMAKMACFDPNKPIGIIFDLTVRIIAGDGLNYSASPLEKYQICPKKH